MTRQGEGCSWEAAKRILASSAAPHEHPPNNLAVVAGSIEANQGGVAAARQHCNWKEVIVADGAHCHRCGKCGACGFAEAHREALIRLLLQICAHVRADGLAGFPELEAHAAREQAVANEISGTCLAAESMPAGVSGDSIGAREPCSAGNPLCSSSFTLHLNVTVEESNSNGHWLSASQIGPGVCGAIETSGLRIRKPQLNYPSLVIRTVSRVQLFTKLSNQSSDSLPTRITQR